MKRPRLQDFPGYILWTLHLVGVSGNTADRQGEGLGGRENEQRSDKLGMREKQSSNNAFKKVRIRERFQSADLRDKIPGRGSFCLFSGLPATAFSGNASDACISYLPSWSAPAPGCGGVWAPSAPRPRRPSARAGREPAGLLPRSPGMGGGSRPRIKAIRETLGGYWPASLLRRGFASTNFLPGP